MNTSKSHWVRNALLAVLAGSMLLGPTSALAMDEEQKGQLLDYFRRKQNLPPAIELELKDVKDSPIEGAKSATITLSRGQQAQEVEVLMSADGRYVVFGELEDVTSDPFAEIAKKITLEGEPVKGPADAPVTIVEYSDFQCPYCARAHDTVANEVLSEYGDKVRLVYKNFPLSFHKWAEPAAIAGECVFQQDEKAFWHLYDYYFANQRAINEENLDEKIKEALADKKIDMEKLEKCTDDPAMKEEVAADMQEGQSIGVTGTPAFYINGRKLSGAQPFDKFKAVIEDELSRAGKSEG